MAVVTDSLPFARSTRPEPAAASIGRFPPTTSGRRAASLRSVLSDGLDYVAEHIAHGGAVEG